VKELRVSLYTMSMKQELELSRRGLPTVLHVTYEIVEEPPRGFPKNPKGLQSRLKRLAPALEAVGIFVFPPSKTDKKRPWGIFTAQTAQPPETPAGVAGTATDAWAVPF
jgi:hypothetical protein